MRSQAGQVTYKVTVDTPPMLGIVPLNMLFAMLTDWNCDTEANSTGMEPLKKFIETSRICVESTASAEGIVDVSIFMCTSNKVKPGQLIVVGIVPVSMLAPTENCLIDVRTNSSTGKGPVS